MRFAGAWKCSAWRHLRASSGTAGKADLQGAGIRYTTVGGDIIVDFTGFSADAQAAFQFAVDILAAQLNLDIPIRLEAVFEPLGADILASAGPNGVFLPTDPNSGLPAVPPALLDQILGMDVLGPGVADIESSFSSTEPNWYFGTNANPAANQFDFVTIVLHELIHGLSQSMPTVNCCGAFQVAVSRPRRFETACCRSVAT